VNSDNWGNRSLLLLALSIALIIVVYFGLFARSPAELDEIDNSSNGTLPVEDGEPKDAFYEARMAMVRNQIQNRDVDDPDVLKAMSRVPRHNFVPWEQRSHAYEDHAMPIGYGQTISQPYIVAVMTEALRLKPGKSRALEVGTGSGYQAAVLAEICKEVYTMEIVSPLATRSNSTLKDLGYNNVHVRNADGYFGWEENAPFDAVIITCAASHIPPPLVEQLADGGRLVLPLGSPHTWQTLTIVEKHGNETTVKYLFPVVFVPMTGQIEEG
jgi:protein-L-isoaspartate(D-aspartate) O-methyltransferase